MARTPRTLAQQAAEHQRKANVLRAKAAKAKKDAEVKAKLALGGAVIEAVLARLTTTGPDGRTVKHLEALRGLFKNDMTQPEWEHFEAWWLSKEYPER